MSAERIKCAAIRKVGRVYEGPDFEDHAWGRGADHWSITQGYPKAELLKGSEFGFVTDAGRFVDRREGARIALAVKQVKELHFQNAELFSEDFNHPDDTNEPPIDPAAGLISDFQRFGLGAPSEEMLASLRAGFGPCRCGEVPYICGTVFDNGKRHSRIAECEFRSWMASPEHAFPCPECGAPSGELCAESNNPRGELRPRAPHRTRIAASEASAK